MAGPPKRCGAWEKFTSLLMGLWTSVLLWTSSIMVVSQYSIPDTWDGIVIVASVSGIAQHYWPCVTDSSGLSTTGSTANVMEDEHLAYAPDGARFGLPFERVERALSWRSREWSWSHHIIYHHRRSGSPTSCALEIYLCTYLLTKSNSVPACL